MEQKFKPVVLIIRDGWGENHNSSEDSFNAVKLATTPIADQLQQDCPRTEIEASGLAVGLPEGIMGNSEVGHQNIGAGRIVDQEIVRINKGIATGSVAESPTAKEAFSNVLAKDSNLHLMGLVSDAGCTFYARSFVWHSSNSKAGRHSKSVFACIYGRS